ncbi:MAG: hypothetical protein ACK4HV_01320 [Parachlamydiaceae bacterium]
MKKLDENETFAAINGALDSIQEENIFTWDTAQIKASGQEAKRSVNKDARLLGVKLIQMAETIESISESPNRKKKKAAKLEKVCAAMKKAHYNYCAGLERMLKDGV